MARHGRIRGCAGGLRRWLAGAGHAPLRGRLRRRLDPRRLRPRPWPGAHCGGSGRSHAGGVARALWVRGRIRWQGFQRIEPAVRQGSHMPCVAGEDHEAKHLRCGHDGLSVWPPASGSRWSDIRSRGAASRPAVDKGSCRGGLTPPRTSPPVRSWRGRGWCFRSAIFRGCPPERPRAPCRPGAQ